LEYTIDEQLDAGIFDSNLIKDNMDVIAWGICQLLLCQVKKSRGVLPHEPVARPLREETERYQDDKTVAISWLAPEFTPVVTLELLFQLQGSSDLLVFQLNYCVQFIARSMCVCEDS
jgi:hypothetical protein